MTWNGDVSIWDDLIDEVAVNAGLLSFIVKIFNKKIFENIFRIPSIFHI